MITTRLAILLALAITNPASAKDTLDTLRSKQAKLESELDDVKRRIADMEASPEAVQEDKPKPTWYVTSWGIDDVNSAGGVEPYFVLRNPNEKTPIKYVRLQVRLYNAVGDVISSEIGSRMSAGLSYTGPLSTTDGDKRVDWGPIWYNTTAHCIKLDSVHITFMDGKTTNFAGPTLRRAVNPSATNECKPVKP